MQRRLILMRHAQSASTSPTTGDHARPLTDKGRREAQEIARRLAELGWSPRAVISSDATRTRQTWEAMAPAFTGVADVIWDESLYLAGVDAIERSLRSLHDDLHTVLMLGHNPGWQQGISYFSGRQEPMSPANAALLQGAADRWEDLAGYGTFRLVEMLRPHTL